MGGLVLLGCGNVGNVGGAFSPRSISGLQLWLRADTISGLNDADSVTTWSDESGNGRDATEATNRPTYETNEINSLPIVKFNGVNDLLTVSHNADLNAGSGFAVFVVVKSLAGAANSGVMGKWNNTNWALLINAVAATIEGQAAVRQADPAASRLAGTGGDMTDGAAHLMLLLWDGSNLYAYRDGTASAATTSGALSEDTTDIFLGRYDNGATWGAVDIGEIAIYKPQPSATQIDSFEDYVQSKWNITMS